MANNPPTEFTIKQCNKKKKHKTPPLVEAEHEDTTDVSFAMKQCRHRRNKKLKTLPFVEEEKNNLSPDDQGCLHAGDILCSHKFEGKFLVYADDTQIPAAQVLSKSVGLLFVKIFNDDQLDFLSPLIKVYNQIQQTHPQAFEVVFVPVFQHHNVPPALVPLKERYLYHLHLGRMPWPAIPLGDNHHSHDWRKHLIQRHENEVSDLYDHCDLFIYDPSGVRLLAHDLNSLTVTQGPDLFPFTEARERQLVDHYASTYLQSKSLQSLLGDVLVTTGQRGQEIIDSSLKTLHISEIKGKVIGLYFYHGIPRQSDRLLHMQFLRDLRECCRRTKHNFEVVFINLDHEAGFRCEESFNSFLLMHPWLLALPFGDNRLRGLTLTLDLVDKDYHRRNHFMNSMVIVGAARDDDDEEEDSLLSFNPFGYEIIQEYGYKAFPFTRERVVEIEKQRMSKLTMNDILEASKTEFLVRSGNGKPKHAVSYLQNKKVILLFLSSLPSSESIKGLRDLQKRSDHSFRVLVLDNCYCQEDNDALPMNLPKKWLRFPPYVHRKIRGIAFTLRTKLKLHFQNEILLAFNENGQFVKMGWLGLLETRKRAIFPFIKDKMFDRIFEKWLLMSKGWILEEDGY